MTGRSGWRDPQLDADESLVDLRCSVLVARDARVLLIRRGDGSRADWVLPGGRPRPGESLGSCARRDAGTRPTWLPLADLAGVNLRPPIAGYLPALTGGRAHTAAYVGNLWRPPVADVVAEAGDAPADHDIIWPS